MSQFIVAKYPRRRRVFVRGSQAGFTNIALGIGRPGVYTIDLGEPKNYTPDSYRKTIRGHGPTNPMVLEFTPTWAVASASGNDANGDET